MSPNFIKRFISKVAALVLFVGLAAPLAIPANADDQGTVFISTNHASGTYTVYTADDVLVGTGGGVDQKQFTMQASEGLGIGYKIVYGNVTGYTTPDTDFFNLKKGDSLTFNGVYTDANTVPGGQGSVTVYTNHASGTYSIYTADDVLVGTGSGVERDWNH